ncbi:hypothetical protein JBE27_18800, partial [Streptomyces albiflaviniger]|nr:hypothetical protein [Streptomyces albiflaviniger]
MRRLFPVPVPAPAETPAETAAGTPAGTPLGTSDATPAGMSAETPAEDREWTLGELADAYAYPEPPHGPSGAYLRANMVSS